MSLIIIGLGNKGPQYSGTRHNVGFQAVDLIAEKLKIKFNKPLFRNYLFGKGNYNSRSLCLVKPLTYVNRSGEVLRSLLRQTKASLQDLVILCDTLDLQPGQCRMKRKGSSAGHNGLASILNHTGTDSIIRIYIGVGRPALKQEVIPYVLAVPKADEEIRIEQALLKVARFAVKLLEEPIEKVMNDLNQSDGSI